MPLTKITNIEGYQKQTHTQLWPNRSLWRRVDRVCSVKCIKFGLEMPGAVNAHTEPTWHNMRLRSFEGYQKHTPTQLWPNRPLWRRVDRVCSVKCIKFGLEMPGAVNAHTEPTWHNMRLRSFEGYQKHTPTQLWPNRPLWRRVDRVCLRPLSLATRCLAQ